MSLNWHLANVDCQYGKLCKNLDIEFLNDSNAYLYYVQWSWAVSDIETEYFFVNVVAEEECLACQQRIEAIVTQSDRQLPAF